MLDHLSPEEILAFYNLTQFPELNPQPAVVTVLQPTQPIPKVKNPKIPTGAISPSAYHLR